MQTLMIIGMLELVFLVFRLVIGMIKINLSDRPTVFAKLINTIETVITVLVLYVLVSSYYSTN